jgi:hypothetical protein
MDDTTIFVRTPAGTQVARDPSVSLPRAMRTLLLSVDGRTPVASYRTILNHLGDVMLLFEGLENAGYLARSDGLNTRAATSNNAATTGRTASSGQLANDLRSLGQMTNFKPTTNPTINNEANTKNFEVLAKIQEAQTHFAQNPPGISQRLGTTNNFVRTANLNAAKSMMTDFLMQHLPDVAMEVSLSLDRIESFDELERSLPDYSQLVARLGRVSVEHLRQVRTLMNK